MSRKELTTRSKILKAALDMLVAGQGTGVRMGDIANRAGISRQALYLHFPTRAELLIATTVYLDEINDTDKRLAASRSATSGTARLDAYIEAWGAYIPEIHGVAKALLAMMDTDEAAAFAWKNRMLAMREGCEAAVLALADDGKLALAPDQATDILWTMLSVRNWEQLTIDCGWTEQEYVARMKEVARRVLVN